MPQPWGLSGAQFFWVYLIAFTASLALLVGARLLAGWRSKVSTELSPYHLAFLAGGANRLLVLGLFDLLATGRAHAARDGRLTMDSGYHYPDPVQQTLASNLENAATWRKRGRRLRDDRALRNLTDDLAKAGLVLRGHILARWLPLMLLPIAVFVTGIVRLTTGPPLDGWVFGLVVLLFASAGIMIITGSVLRREGAWQSPRGMALIRRLQREHRADRSDEARRRELSEIPRTAVAVLGTSAVLDLRMLTVINGPGVRADFLAAAGGSASTSPTGCNAG